MNGGTRAHGRQRRVQPFGVWLHTACDITTGESESDDCGKRLAIGAYAGAVAGLTWLDLLVLYNGGTC